MFDGAAFGGGQFFVFGRQPDEYNDLQLLVRTSNDGTNWTYSTAYFSPHFSRINRIIYSGGRFFVFGRDHDSDSLAKTTTDFTNSTGWGVPITDHFSGWYSSAEIVHGANRFFAFRDGTPLVKSSTYGKTWQNVADVYFDDFELLHGISFGSGKFIAFGGHNNEEDPLIKTSVSEYGTSWNPVTDVFGDPNFYINYISFAEGRFFAFGSRWEGVGSNTLRDYQTLAESSTNGITWTPEPFLVDHFESGGLKIREVLLGGGRTFVLAYEWINGVVPQQLDIVVFVKD